MNNNSNIQTFIKDCITLLSHLWGGEIYILSTVTEKCFNSYRFYKIKIKTQQTVDFASSSFVTQEITSRALHCGTLCYTVLTYCKNTC